MNVFYSVNVTFISQNASRSSSSREGSGEIKVRSPVRTGYEKFRTRSPSKSPLRKTREMINNLGKPLNSVATGSSKSKKGGKKEGGAATGRTGMTVEQLEDMQKALEVKSSKKRSRSSTNNEKLSNYDPKESYTQEKKRRIDKVLSEDNHTGMNYKLLCIY